MILFPRKSKEKNMPQHPQPRKQESYQEHDNFPADQLTENDEAVRIAAMTLRNILKGDRS